MLLKSDSYSQWWRFDTLYWKNVKVREKIRTNKKERGLFRIYCMAVMFEKSSDTQTQGTG